MIKNINVEEYYNPETKNNIDLTPFINQTSASASAPSRRSSSEHRRHRRTRSKHKNRSKKHYINRRTIRLPRIALDTDLSMVEIREYLVMIGLIKPNSSAPEDLLKYLYLSADDEIINVKKH